MVYGMGSTAEREADKDMVVKKRPRQYLVPLLASLSTASPYLFNSTR